MKKLLSVSFASLAIAAVAADFSPSIGVKQFTSTEDNFLLPVKFDSLSQSQISAKELVATNGLALGTALYVFQNDAYTSWILQPEGWTAAAKVSDTELAPTAPNPTQKLAAGSAIWITDVKGKTFSIYGKVITAKTSTIVRGKTNLLVNPTDETVSGEALASKLGAVVQAKDRITPIGNTFSGYYVYSGSNWIHVGTTITNPATLPDLAANQGFWYVSKGTGDAATINW